MAGGGHGANVVDHVTPHRRNWNVFVTGELQSLCEPRHKSAKRQIEPPRLPHRHGLDGYPASPRSCVRLAVAVVLTSGGIGDHWSRDPRASASMRVLILWLPFSKSS